MEDGFPTTTLGNDKGNVNDKKNSWVAHRLRPSPELAEGWDLHEFEENPPQGVGDSV